MSEIKFQAWDNANRKMYGVGEQEDMHFYFDSSGIKAEWFFSSAGDSEILEHLIYRQYTGLKDNDGKEIYVGDIVSMFQGTQKSEVLFDGGMFSVKRAYRRSFYNDELELRHEILFNVIDTCEVIGNIYDNPELLEE